MSKLAQRSDLWFKLNNGQPVDLTVSITAGTKATAKLYRDKIIVECDSVTNANHINISTPLAFEVINMHTIHDDSQATTVQIKNYDQNITNALTITSIKEINHAGSIDETYSTFGRGDDDLRAYIAGAGAFTGKIVIKIEPIVQ